MYTYTYVQDVHHNGHHNFSYFSVNSMRKYFEQKITIYYNQYSILNR